MGEEVRKSHHRDAVSDETEGFSFCVKEWVLSKELEHLVDGRFVDGMGAGGFTRREAAYDVADHIQSSRAAWSIAVGSNRCGHRAVIDLMPNLFKTIHPRNKLQTIVNLARVRARRDVNQPLGFNKVEIT